jgi:hypothetical protein
MGKVIELNSGKGGSNIDELIKGFEKTIRELDSIESVDKIVAICISKEEKAAILFTANATPKDLLQSCVEIQSRILMGLSDEEEKQ